MLKDNLVQLRKLHKMTQEDLADKVGVTRQAIAKWECGESVPDLEKSRLLAEAFNVSLDDMVNFDASANMGLGVGPKGKHLFGIVKVGDKGQIVIPARARKVFDINPGDNLIVLGDEGTGIAIMKSDTFLDIADKIRKGL